ncbi:helix-turn-helix domain-containing protein [Salmonella enterica subsp. enterica serovar Infantis]|nr:helix-turn-helix domain-containing protein [Salmonella enterica]EEG2784271.1 helix-turn-helix domain-containing protein [Salmonella enterica]EEJ3970363.1 helix-turn-helix domain-containing protein [Salmonella enterica subsp. enterica serovar Gatuni]EHC4524928.1 helix-turn-helix domain-containing protein [Salmonella enterica subsp. enterica serovar Infantis]EHC5874447.1 helix-turn-helix domain-containing protein [Salmonella enterica subsp. enterica serovar Eastbourne]
MYNLCPGSARKWAYVYREHGIEILSGNKGRHSADFKLMVVKEVVDGGFPARETAFKHGLPDLNTIYQWIDKYRKYGDDAFTIKHRKINTLTDKNIVPSTPAPELSNKERDEFGLLGDENANLKKLKALAPTAAGCQTTPRPLPSPPPPPWNI